MTCDCVGLTPWHVRQPQAKPWDINKSNDEVIEETRATFENEPGFSPIEEFYRSHSQALSE